MATADGGRRWTLEEEGILRKEWLAMVALGKKRIAITRRVATRLGRTVSSVYNKAAQMKLNRPYIG